MPSTRSSAKKEQVSIEESMPSTGDKRKAKNETPKTASKQRRTGSKDRSEIVNPSDEKSKDKSQDENDEKKSKDKAEHKAEDTADKKQSDRPARDSRPKSDDTQEASTIIEKGIIYFFARGRVNTEQPHTLQDIARSYFVLRPLPDSYDLSAGKPLEDRKNNRLFALPKKYLPKSHSDVFMAFVEKANASVQELKDDFLQGADYETKTSGIQHTPAAIPVGEGVYALTQVGRNNHLAYMLTLPSEPGDVQKQMGVAAKGSFVLSVKNPDQKGPPQASLPQGPDYTSDMKEEFGSLRWLGSFAPKFLDYPNAQILMIGEGADSIDKAVNQSSEDVKELEQFEEDDHKRVKSLDGEHAVYEDLKISQEQYPKLKTTW